MTAHLHRGPIRAAEALRRRPFFTVAGLGLLALASTLHGAAYLKIEGIDGESKEAEHEDWIVVESFGSGLRLVGEAGATRSTLRATQDPLAISKPLDRSTPYLLDALFKGTSLPSVVLESEHPSGALGPVRLRLELENAAVRSYSTRNREALTALEPIVEDWSFEAEAWAYHYIRVGNGQVPGEMIGATWNFLSQSGGLTNVDAPARPQIEPFDTLVAVPGGSYLVELVVNDEDTPLGELNIVATSLDPAKVQASIVTGKAGEPVLQLAASDLFSGSAAVRVSASDGFQTASRTLMLSIEGGSTPYETYLLAAFGDALATDNALGLPLLDPENDGLRTITEFYLGTDPNLPTAAGDAMQSQIIMENQARVVRLAFFRRSDMPGLTGKILASPDMETWNEVSEQTIPSYSEEVNQGNGPYEQVKATLVLPFDGWESCFLQIQVEGAF